MWRRSAHALPWHWVAVLLLLPGCTMQADPPCEPHVVIVDGEQMERCGPSSRPPCRADGLTAHVSWSPPPDTYHGVFVRLLDGDTTVTSDIADDDGCADLDAPPGDYRIVAQLRTQPDCGYDGETGVAYTGGVQHVTVHMRATC